MVRTAPSSIFHFCIDGSILVHGCQHEYLSQHEQRSSRSESTAQARHDLVDNRLGRIDLAGPNPNLEMTTSIPMCDNPPNPQTTASGDG